MKFLLILLFSTIQLFGYENNFIEPSQLNGGIIFFKSESEATNSFNDISGSLGYSYAFHKYLRFQYDLAYIPENEEGATRLSFSQRELINGFTLSTFYPFYISPFIGAGIGYNMLLNRINTDIAGYDFDTEIDHSIGFSIISGVDFFQNIPWGMRFFGAYSNGFIFQNSSTIYFGIHLGLRL